MATQYPYVGVTKKIPVLFDKVGTAGIPAKVDNKWLEQYGMASTNDRPLKGILQFLGFTDASGAPTQLWRDFRGHDGKAKLAGAIRISYADLFHAIPNAHMANVDELTRYIRSHSGLGTEAVSRAVTTFRTLVGLADLSAIAAEAQAPERTRSNGASGQTDSEAAPEVPDFVIKRGQGPSVTINVNLQLALPESTDPKVYDALFGSLAKHILPKND